MPERYECPGKQAPLPKNQDHVALMRGCCLLVNRGLVDPGMLVFALPKLQWSFPVTLDAQPLLEPTSPQWLGKAALSPCSVRSVAMGALVNAHCRLRAQQNARHDQHIR
jgi:hypothetical protein